MDSQPSEPHAARGGEPWPETRAPCSGNATKCQMNFHFPDHAAHLHVHPNGGPAPDRDIPGADPLAIPPNCQWALVLRNHDELTPRW